MADWVTGGMVPPVDLLPDVLPTDRLNASGVPVPELRAELRRIPTARNALTIVGVWVQVALPMDHLSAFDVPGFNCERGEGSRARVWQDLGGQMLKRGGRVIRLLGDLDPVGRMARVLIEIRDPFGLEAKRAKKPNDALNRLQRTWKWDRSTKGVWPRLWTSVRL